MQQRAFYHARPRSPRLQPPSLTPHPPGRAHDASDEDLRCRGGVASLLIRGSRSLARTVFADLERLAG
jgi:hypothetical protein